MNEDPGGLELAVRVIFPMIFGESGVSKDVNEAA
jgi:hypothetical protein